MQTLVIGGTGFIGLHIVNALAQDQQVSVLCRTPAKAKEILPVNVKLIQGDVDSLTIADAEKLIKPFDKLVYAAGVDERSKPVGNPFDFYYRGNVAPCQRLFTAVRQSNISHVVLLNSIFSYMDREYPELELTKHHPYVYSRVEQNKIAHKLAENAFILTVLEVPWVFGHSHREMPLWSSLVNYVRGAVPLLITNGGANMMSATSVAQAVKGGLIYPKQSCTLPIGDVNMTWKQLIEKLCECTRRKDMRINIVPDSLFREMTVAGGVLKELLGEQSGLDTAYMAGFVLKEVFYDPSASQTLLNYRGGDLLQAIQETVDTVPENKHLRIWRKYINFFSSDFLKSLNRK